MGSEQAALFVAAGQLPSNTLTCASDVVNFSVCIVDALNLTSSPQSPFFPKCDLSYVRVDASAAFGVEVL